MYSEHNAKSQLIFEDTAQSDNTDSTSVSDSDNPDTDMDMENKIDPPSGPIGDDPEKKDNTCKITSDNLSKDINTVSDTTSEE